MHLYCFVPQYPRAPSLPRHTTAFSRETNFGMTFVSERPMPHMIPTLAYIHISPLMLLPLILWVTKTD
jgi:predicted AlkP superfamily pyrophosphatase or phosphodiesterase